MANTPHPTAERIHQVARRLFVKRSYSDVTMDEIAVKAQITKGALYHHFKSKEALYLAMMEADLSEKQVLFNKAVTTGGSAQQRLEILTRTFLDLSVEKKRISGLIRRDINTISLKARTRLLEMYQEALPSQVQSIIEEGIAEGEIRPVDARLLSFSFISLVEHTISQHGTRTLKDNDKKIQFVIGLLFNGIAAKK